MRVESPSSPREGCSVSAGIRLVMWVRSLKVLVKFKSKSRILGDGKPQGVPAECIFGRGKGAAVRQMSGEVCAAAKVSECCDAVGEESRNSGSPQSTTAKRGHFVGFQ